MIIEIGHVVGDYQVLASLGAGGVGRVYKVRHAITGRIEALKVLLPDYEQDEQQAERFLREVKVQANLSHPNIASVHNAFRAAGSLLMVMEFVEGESLDRLIARGRLPLPQALDYASQALSALSYAHSCGVVHRDVKPENMLVTPSGQLKVTDFGLAKTTTDIRLTVTGATVGSLYYISPEQVNGATDLDDRADIYSMGAVLYELVTGRRPFEGAQPFHLMLAHVEQPPKPPIELNSSLPPALSDVILRALEKRPEGRFASAQELRNALDAAVASSPGSVKNLATGVAGVESSSARNADDAVGAATGTEPGRKPAQRRARRTGPTAKRVLAGLSLIAVVASLATFIAWRVLKPDPTKTVAVPSGNHRLLRKVIPTGTVQAVVFNAEDNLAAVLTSKGIVEVWEPGSGEKRASFSGADRRSGALALSPNGTEIVFAARDSALRLWDVVTGEEKLRLETGREVRSVAISADGKLLAAASDRFVTVWELDGTGQYNPIHRQEYGARLVTFRPDGASLAAAGESSVHVHLLEQPGSPSQIPMDDGGLTAIAFDRGRDIMAAAGSSRLTVWNSNTFEEVQTAALPGNALALGFMRSGQCLALTFNGQQAQIWNAIDGTEVSGFLHSDDVRAAALSADGRLAATATTAGDLWFWKADSAWDPVIVPSADQPESQRVTRPNGKPRKNVLRRFVDVFRGRK